MRVQRPLDKSLFHYETNTYSKVLVDPRYAYVEL